MAASTDVRSARDLLESAARFVAPVTVLAATLAYVGWTRTQAYFSYFGVDSSLLGLSLQDLMLRSAASMFTAVANLTVFAIAIVVVDFAADAALRRLRARWWRLLLGALGALALMFGLLGALSVTAALIAGPWFPAAGLAAGAALLVRAIAPRRPRWRTIRMNHDTARAHYDVDRAHYIALAVALLAAFWAMTLDAKQLGADAAQLADRSPQLLSEVALLSEKPLNLAGDFMTATRFPSDDGKFDYEYVGLRSLAYSNGRWFLLVGHRDGHHSTVLVLHDSDTLRVEIAASA
jgi:hypothetical protein